MLKMAFNKVLVGLIIFMVVSVYGVPKPGGGRYHVHHRIHVPQEIKTIYRTKIIKIPEHHHHFHEKEKIIIEKEKPKEHFVHTPLLHEEEHDWEGLESSHVFKKKRYVTTSPPPKSKPRSTPAKKRKIVRTHFYDRKKD